MGEVRCCVVGMGIGKPNGRALAADPRGRVTALCDLDEVRMKAFAKELPEGEAIRCYTDYREMCRDKSIDAVFVGTPNQWHVPIALEAIRRNKHVLVTKPLADSLAAAESLVSAAESSGLVNMMSLSTRFGAPVRYLGELAAAGEFGGIYYARARSMRRSGIPSWSRGFVEAGGGAFRDMGVHVLDSAWWIMGMPEPVSVTGVAGAKFGPRGQGYTNFQPVPAEYSGAYASDDYAGGFIRFADGSGMQVESFWASHMWQEGVQIEIFGDEAGARLQPLTIYKTVNGAPQDSTVGLPKGKEAWDAIAGHFIECILDGVPCTAPLRHGLLVQAMLEGLLSSAETGAEVRLDRV